MATATRPGSTSGRMTCTMVRILPAPSIFADSSSAFGTVSKNDLSSVMESGKAKVTSAKITPR